MRRAKRLIAAVCFTAAAFAGEQQSVISPAGPQAGKIAGLWWFFVVVTAAVFVIVMVLTVWTLMRRHRGIEQEPLEVRHLPSEQTEKNWAGPSRAQPSRPC